MRPRPSPPFDWLQGEVLDLRERYEQAFRVEDPGLNAWMNLPADGRSLRLLRQQPARRRGADAALLYFHGGGWIVGSPSTHADISRRLCDRTGLDLISVDYRLAPEHQAPAPIEDGLAALIHLLSTGAGGLGRRSAILCGDSAGAAIALALERRLEEPMRRQVLGVGAFYGSYGLLEHLSSQPWGSRAEGLDQGSVARYWRLAHGPAEPSPYAIGALAAPSTVPAYLLAAARDPLLPDSLALAEAYRRCGRPFTLDLAEGVGHGFLHEANGSKPAAAALARVSAWIDGLIPSP
ncbi:MAG TPA: alpha/beta hydrolase fold domain-containing protein [Hypericibacter adhaerens]|jgi:acetyl esterase|nr:alpha/beta hydrolase fold domain-containing protein [Hypericibacter adhaerens]HWA43259.1 alpha/beta hydrolase fold domain-containing protein [Hypericibacter adhaerens]